MRYAGLQMCESVISWEAHINPNKMAHGSLAPPTMPSYMLIEEAFTQLRHGLSSNIVSPHNGKYLLLKHSDPCFAST